MELKVWNQEKLTGTEQVFDTEEISVELLEKQISDNQKIEAPEEDKNPKPIPVIRY